MAVYTRIEPDDLHSLLADYSIGSLESFCGISAGITNTNYFVDTDVGRWVLTLFEQINPSELPFFMQLMDHLSSHGVPCAHPVARNDGGFLSRVRGQPAALVHRLCGVSEEAPDSTHCHALGGVVAAMHRAVSGFTQTQGNSRGLAWIEQASRRLDGMITPDDQALLVDEIAFQRQASRTLYPNLPAAVVHADLFRDNVLFRDGRVTGVIDFYYACHDHLLFDLAIICNDWAFDHEQRHSTALWHAFMAHYTQLRQPNEDEVTAWPAMLRSAALRFWVSRLVDACFPMSGEDVHIKDPAPFRRLLLSHRNAPPALVPT